MSPPTEISLDRGEGQLLVGVSAGEVALSAAVSDGADADEIEEATRALYQELRHSARLGGSS